MTVKKTEKNNSCREFFSDGNEKTFLKRETVTVPEWGNRVFHMIEPTAGAMSDTRNSALDENGKLDPSMNAYWMMSLCMVESDYKTKVFDDAEHCKKSLKDRGAVAVARLVNKAGGLMGIDVEAAAKNLQETTVGSSSTD